MPNYQILAIWKELKTKISRWTKSYHLFHQQQELLQRFQAKSQLVESKRAKLRSLLKEDSDKVWNAPESVNDPNLIKRGQQIGKLEIEIIEAEKGLKNLENDLKKSQTDPLALQGEILALKRELDFWERTVLNYQESNQQLTGQWATVKSLVANKQFTELQELIKQENWKARF